MTNEQLSQHFTLAEFTRSDTAQHRGIDNTPSLSVVVRLSGLCHNVLEPLRRFAARPIVISSGYRSPALNKAVGGVSNSQHLTGEACDIRPPLLSPQGEKLTAERQNAILQQWYDYIKQHLPHDQLIMERSSSKSSTFWIHVSCRIDLTRNRSQCIPMLNKQT